jgi:hypothetical protein
MWLPHNNFANGIFKIEKVQEIIAENKLKNKVSSLRGLCRSHSRNRKDFNNAMGKKV